MDSATLKSVKVPSTFSNKVNQPEVMLMFDNYTHCQVEIVLSSLLTSQTSARRSLAPSASYPRNVVSMLRDVF